LVRRIWRKAQHSTRPIDNHRWRSCLNFRSWCGLGCALHLRILRKERRIKMLRPSPFMDRPQPLISAQDWLALPTLARVSICCCTDAIFLCLWPHPKLDGLGDAEAPVLCPDFPRAFEAAGLDATSAFAAARAGGLMLGRCGICALPGADRDGLFTRLAALGMVEVL